MVLTDRARERERMVERQLRARGVRDERVLDAFREVPRELFVEPGLEQFVPLIGQASPRRLPG